MPRSKRLKLSVFSTEPDRMERRAEMLMQSVGDEWIIAVAVYRPGAGELPQFGLRAQQLDDVGPLMTLYLCRTEYRFNHR